MCIRDSNGVIKTTAGFEGGKEVVVVEYNPSIISKAELDKICLLYTSDAADERSSVDPGGRRIIKKQK